MNLNDSPSKNSWAGEVASALAESGVRSVAELLRQFPGEPYVDIARRYGSFTAAALVRAQMREAISTDQIRMAAMDCLVREINEALPEGWGVGERIRFRTSAVGALWIAELTAETDKGDLRIKTFARSIWKEIKDLPPDRGWRPVSVDDPLIQHAFSEHWPK